LFTAAYVVLSLSMAADPWLLMMLARASGFNAWLGLFNMIPAGPFDGAKVLAWSKPIFVATVLIGLVLTFGIDVVLVRDLVYGWLNR
jgi:Zn-dependent protease